MMIYKNDWHTQKITTDLWRIPASFKAFKFDNEEEAERILKVAKKYLKTLEIKTLVALEKLSSHYWEMQIYWSIQNKTIRQDKQIIQQYLTDIDNIYSQEKGC